MFQWLLFDASCEVSNHCIKLPMNNWSLIYGYGRVRVVDSFSRLSPLLKSMTKMISSLLINSPGVQIKAQKKFKTWFRTWSRTPKKVPQLNKILYHMQWTKPMYLFGRWFCPSTASTILLALLVCIPFRWTLLGKVIASCPLIVNYCQPAMKVMVISYP